MLSALFRPLLLCLALASPAVLAAPALAADISATAKYAVSLGGTQVATVTIRLDASGTSYAMSLDARISGLASLVASGSARMSSKGAVQEAGLKAQRFNLTTRIEGATLTSDITFSNSAVETFIVAPPIINNIDRVPIERRQLDASSDMMAPFVLRGSALDGNLCNRRLAIFTGLERFNLTLRHARGDVATSKRTGYQGPVVVCAVKYVPISGHYTTSDITRYLTDSDRILIWYAPLPVAGWYIPYRALVTTESGDLSMVLTDLE